MKSAVKSVSMNSFQQHEVIAKQGNVNIPETPKNSQIRNHNNKKFQEKKNEREN